MCVFYLSAGHFLAGYAPQTLLIRWIGLLLHKPKWAALPPVLTLLRDSNLQSRILEWVALIGG